MATVGTIVANLIANTTKFSAPVNKARRDVYALERQIFRLKGVGAPPTWLMDLFKGAKQGVGGALAGQFLKGGLVGGGAFGLGLAGVELLQTAFEKLRPVVAKSFDDIRLNLLGIPKFARMASKSIDELAQSYAKLQAANQTQLAKTQEKVQAAFGLDKVRPLPLLSDEETKAFNERRAVLEKARMDAIKRFQSLAFGEDPVTKRRGRGAFIDRGIRELQLRGESTLFKRPELGAQFDREISKANRDLRRIERDMTRLDTLVKGTQFVRRIERLQPALQPFADFARFTGVAAIGKQALNDPAAFLNSRVLELADLPNVLGRALGRSLGRFVGEQGLSEEEEAIRNRALRLQQDFDRPQLTVKGTNEFLRAIHDDNQKGKEDLSQLVRLAKEEIEQERRQAKEIGEEIARQRVTVNM